MSDTTERAAPRPANAATGQNCPAQPAVHFQPHFSGGNVSEANLSEAKPFQAEIHGANLGAAALGNAGRAETDADITRVHRRFAHGRHRHQHRGDSGRIRSATAHALKLRFIAHIQPDMSAFDWAAHARSASQPRPSTQAQTAAWPPSPTSQSSACGVKSGVKNQTEECKVWPSLSSASGAGPPFAYTRCRSGDRFGGPFRGGRRDSSLQHIFGKSRTAAPAPSADARFLEQMH